MEAEGKGHYGVCFMIIADLDDMSLLCYCLGSFEFSAILKSYLWRLMFKGFVLSSAEIVCNTFSFYCWSYEGFITVLLKSVASHLHFYCFLYEKCLIECNLFLIFHRSLKL